MKIVFIVKHVTGEYRSEIRNMTEEEAHRTILDACNGCKMLTFHYFTNYSSRNDDWEKGVTIFSTTVLKESVISYQIVR